MANSLEGLLQGARGARLLGADDDAEFFKMAADKVAAYNESADKTLDEIMRDEGFQPALLKLFEIVGSAADI